ncbi:MAG: PINc/VapC family ATPase [Candidatus Aenigmarchaeota archaeon]|nr:PINc/VapC family ATPase [Candidatus Aenigmarchaeota archaeon]
MVMNTIRNIANTGSKTLVPDTSVLINRKLSELIEEGKLNGIRIVVPRIVIDELQAQASRGKDIGFRGLEEIKKVRLLAEKHKIKLSFDGDRPSQDDISLAKKGRLDALIRDFAVKEGATLLTSDYVQALVGEAENVSIEYVPYDISHKEIKIEGFFTPDTQSVHLKVGVRPYAKRGKPGEVKLVHIREKLVDEDELKTIVYEILSKVHKDPSSFIEIGRQGASAMVVQMGLYRIAITRPPFSSATEITAVRPIVKLELKDYALHKDLEDALVNDTRGVLIAGPPGSGKSTFAASVAEFLCAKGKIVKTFEQPRDLQVGPEITQYAPLEGDWEKTAEMLLLVRPDYTVFDEVRKTKDFRVFADMRLAGVGMIGVVHATDIISAVQRFMGRIELGMIPHVVDTIIYIRNGRIERIYTLGLLVKVPSGMTEADLARPVVEVRDFETKKLEYEIYTFGEENVVIPIKEASKPVVEKVTRIIKQEMGQIDENFELEFASDNRVVLRVNNDAIAQVIGKKGRNIEELERRAGIRITVEPLQNTFKHDVSFEIGERGKAFSIILGNEHVGKQIDIYDGETYLFSPVIGGKGEVRIKKKSDEGKKILYAISARTLRVLV